MFLKFCKKTLYYLLSICALQFLLLSNTFALQISEIQFDPSGTDTDREWIEVYNDTTNTIDLTQIKFFEANANHGIDIWNTNNSTEKSISAGEYVVIVQDINKFKTDFPDYMGKIFKSSFSLSNTGETLALKDKDGNILFSVNYTESDRQAVASPGAQNPPNPLYQGGTSATSTNTNESSSNSTTTETNTNNIFTPVYTVRNFWPEVEKIYVKAGDNQIVMAGQTFVTQPKVLDTNKKEFKNTLQYRWNFGDGHTSEDKNAKHFYKFPGEYIIYLEVNNLGNIESDKFYIKVVEPEIDLQFSDKKGELGLEIENQNNTEINIGEMILRNEQYQNFNIPKNTMILPKKSLFLPFDTLKFSTSTNFTQLSFLNGKVVAEVKGVVSSSLLGEGVVKAQEVVKKQIVEQGKKRVIEGKKMTISREENVNTGVYKTDIGAKPMENQNRIEFKNEKKILNIDILDKLKSIWSF